MRKDLPCCSPVTKITGTTKTLSLRLLMVMYLLAGTFIISSGQLAGTAPVNPPFGGFAIDGNVVRATGDGDWTGTGAQAPNTYVLNPTTGAPLIVMAYRLFDRYNDQDLDDIFDGGNKLFQNPNTWGWRSQKPPAKDDMNNAAALLTMAPSDGHIWLIIAGDRMSTNGTSYLDFELYKNTITKTGGPLTGGFNSTGPNGGRTIGDISITLQYTAGGSFAAVSFLKWTNTSETTFDYVDTIPPTGSAYAAANGGNIPIPYGAFGLNTYQPLQFIEGAIDITRMLGAISDPADCARLPFKSLFIKTKSSAERTADLKDFIEPIQINACFDRTKPVFTSCPAGSNLGCNPVGLPLPAGAVATDNCGVVTVSSSEGAVVENGCQRTQVRTYLAEDGCGNTETCTQTFTWTVDVTPPTISITGGNLNPGCNPEGAINFGSASGSDNCAGAVTLTSTAGSITTSGCTRTQTMTWNAIDGCLQSSSTTRTATWTVDTQGPVITITGGNLNPGCNPGTVNFGSASANDNCSGASAVTSTAGTITTTGCSRTQTMTWNASDACNNSSSTSRTATWTVDTQGPVITITGGNLNPGCNPASINFGSASANDNCAGAVPVTSTAGTITTTGCSRTQTMTWNASDACNNSSSTSRTATWTVDTDGPVITITGGNLNPGCNPASINFGSASANDNCAGAVPVTSTAGTITTTGCSRTQTMTWNASDACNNSSSTSRTATWTVDTQGPVITITGGNLNPGCNPASNNFGSASANDNCAGAVPVTSTAGTITTSGCTRTQTMTWNASDACNNSSSTSRTATWTVDVIAPVFTNPPASVDLDCSAAIPTVPTVTATDNCGGTPGVVYNGQTDNPSNCQTGFQRIIVRTWTATDACGNTAVHTQTIRVKCCVPICTLTQGGYGQYGGTICLPNGQTVLQHSLMATALDSEPGDSVVFGKQSNNKYWVVSLSDVNNGANSNILKMLPGGGGSFVLGADIYSNAPKYSNAPSWPVAPLAGNGKIRNTLLAQTITFYFNTKVVGSGIGSLILNGDSAIISDRVCGSLVPVPGTRDTVELISPTVVSYMSSHGYPATAAGLLQLANDALGGVNVRPLSLSDIAGAVDRINNVFDNCVLLEGYVAYVSSNRGSSSHVVRQALPANELNVTAFPNPYEEQNFSLRINAPVSGQATIEFFTIDGQKISEIKRTIVANRDEVVTFKVPGVQKSKIAYVVKVGKYNSKGIVLSPN